jgi:hypothetical protein
MKEEVAKSSLYSNALMIITSIHHVYGAVVYHTPWRLHILMVSIPVIIFTLVGSHFLTKREFLGKNLLLVLYWSIILIFSIILIGGYEGVYNHALKNVFFFSGASETILDKMFPPSMYVMPNNFLFELTGVMQAAIFVPLLIQMARLSKKLKGTIVAMRG